MCHGTRQLVLDSPRHDAVPYAATQHEVGCNPVQHVATPYSGLLLALPSVVEWRVGAAASSSLSACNSGAIYAAWGATFQAAWPTLNYACTVGSVTCAMCITNANIGTAVTA